MLRFYPSRFARRLPSARDFRDWDRRRDFWSSTLQDDVAAAAPDFCETGTLQNPADLLAGQVRRLPNRYLDAGDEYFGMQSAVDLGGIRGFEKQFQRFNQVLARFFDRLPLAGDIELSAESHIRIFLPFNDRRQLSRRLHT
jgi:hypothetical protein